MEAFDMILLTPARSPKLYQEVVLKVNRVSCSHYLSLDSKQHITSVLNAGVISCIDTTNFD